MIRAVIFDCFGVIITDVLAVLMAELHDQPEKLQVAHDAVRAANKGLLERKESNKIIAETLGISVSEYRAKIDGDEVKNIELLGYVRELRQEYKTALLSNITRAGIDHRFTQAELMQHFDAVIVSGDIGYAKPEPEAYEIAADRLGVRLDECVFTDDRAEFCEAARRVGMQAIAFKDVIQFKTELEQLLRS